MSDKLSKKRGVSSILDSFDSEDLAVIDAFKKLQKKHNLDVSQLGKLLGPQEKQGVPISIFNNGLSPLEALAQYLKKDHNFHQIGELLNRNEKTIWTTYNNSLKKKVELDFSGDVYVPLSIFSDRRLSILESLCNHLVSKGFKLSEIARLLGKDRRVVWTVCNRAKKKMEVEKKTKMKTKKRTEQKEKKLGKMPKRGDIK